MTSYKEVQSYDFHNTVGPDELVPAIQVFHQRNVAHGPKEIFDTNKIINVRDYIGKARFIISSQPSTNTTFIVDDFLMINGRLVLGFNRLIENPTDPSSIGKPPNQCYEGVIPLDISKEVRADGLFIFHLWNAGGGPYCNTSIWLRIVKS